VCAPAGQRGLNAGRLGRRQMVQHDHISWRQWGAEERRDIAPKDVGSGGTLPHHDRVEPRNAEGPQQGDSRPRVQGDGPHTPLPPRGTAIQARHHQLAPGFSHKLHAPEIAPGCPLLGGGTGLGHPRPGAFGGMQGLVFRGSPRRWRTRHLEATLRHTPRRGGAGPRVPLRSPRAARGVTGAPTPASEGRRAAGVPRHEAVERLPPSCAVVATTARETRGYHRTGRPQCVGSHACGRRRRDLFVVGPEQRVSDRIILRLFTIEAMANRSRLWARG
jgi:hypothetical protein